MFYYLDLFGCAKNQVDAENMMNLFSRSGWTAAENAENADLIIVYSCGFIESAKQESINAVILWRKLYPEKKIFLVGCLAQRYAQDLADALPEADGFFGINDAHRIIAAAEKTIGRTQAQMLCPLAEGMETAGSRPLLSLPGSAYVKISEGCDNRCSYCAIPIIRGNLRSRNIADIFAECETLLERGIKELCLVGQDTGSYGRDLHTSRSGTKTGSSIDLPSLLETLSRLKGIFRVRLLYIHPDNFPLPILDIIENDKRFLPYFDIPFQHASEKILKAMGRRGNAEIYLELIGTIRRRLPDAVLRSTFLTGFPGETDEDFEQLLNFQKKACLDWMGCFAYSREEGTPAWNMKGRVSKKTALERKRVLEENQIPITEKQMDRFIGRVFDVLVEEKIDSGHGNEPPIHESSIYESSIYESLIYESPIYLGRLPFQAPDVDGAAVITGDETLEPGVMIPCRVMARAGFDLEVQPV